LLCLEFLDRLTSKTNKFPSQEDLTGAANALLRLQDTYALSTERLAGGDIQGVTDSSLMTGIRMSMFNSITKF
jgi:prolyl 4-hydroxylase